MKKAMAQLQGMPVGRGNFERKTNHDGQFLFYLKDANGQILGHSLPYGSEAGMENGIKNLINSLNALKEEYDL
ncbi:YegP family protein [Zobellia galactanivorans]|nr:YegP family protein [Zobellia galactanivorans]